MNTIIISDTHLTRKFDQKKFNYLKQIIESCNQVIINGDFWDKYFCTFNQFINSEWQTLFPLLLEKQAIYLYGNHDKKEWCNQHVSEFSVEQKIYTSLKVGNKELYITHGDEIAPDFDGRHPWIPVGKFTGFLGYQYEKIGLAISGDKFLVRAYTYLNDGMKKWAKEKLKENQILVGGHSHLAEFNLKEKHINTGFIRFGYGQYLKIENDILELIEEKY